jgi:Ca2+-binding RTX toxin-like protein
MSIHFRIFDSAHRYGFDDMPVTGAAQGLYNKRIGDDFDSTDSWGSGTPTTGKLETSVTRFTGGYTQNATMIFSDDALVTYKSIDLLRTDTGETLTSLTGDLVLWYAGPGAGSADPAYLFAGDDTIVGNAYGNLLKAYAGNDLIDGGGGLDTAVFDGRRDTYDIARQDATLTVKGLDGTDTLRNVERLRFEDIGVAFDHDGAAGQTYRLYHAALGRAPDLKGLGFWIDAMDTGTVNLSTLAAEFASSTEFRGKYQGLNTVQLVESLYRNVLHREGDAGGIAFWSGILENKQESVAGVLAAFAESSENKLALVGILEKGIAYVPFY